MIDFASVQWARKMNADLESLLARPGDDLQKIAHLLEKLAPLKEADQWPTEAQMTVLLQNLHTKELVLLEGVRGGNLMVEFRGGGYEYERFLLREDGRMPNHKYEAKKAAKG
jgi:hypothetical protein